MNVNNRLIKTYIIRSLKQFDELKEEIIQISNATKSRVYINLNRRSFEDTTLHTLRHCVEYISDKNYSGITQLVDSICGKYRNENNPTWIIDVDNVIRSNSNYVKQIINYVENECEPIGNKFKCFIPTVNGIHIITSPFNLQKFKSEYSDIDVHKNNPTLLYFNGN